jgi:hypothetical protein
MHVLKTRSEWLSAACQIYYAVQILHQNGFYHLGINMENIGVNFVNYNKTVKIGDVLIPTFGKQYILLDDRLTVGPGCDMTKYTGRRFNGANNLETFDSVRALACTFIDNLYEYMRIEKPPVPADYFDQVKAKIDRNSWPLSELSDDNLKSSRLVDQIYFIFYSDTITEILMPDMVKKLTVTKYLNDEDYIFMIKNYENVPAIVKYLAAQLTQITPVL